MTDLWFPNWLRVSSQRVDVLGNSVAARSPYSQKLFTTQRGGERLKYAISIQNASNRETDAVRAKLMSLRAQLRGMGGRIWYSPAGYQQRGSFPSQEMLSNCTFGNGVAGWTVTSGGVLTVSDRVARMTVAASGAAQEFYQGVSHTQNAPYVARAIISDGQNTTGKTLGPFIDGGLLSYYSSVRGLLIASGVVVSASGNAGISGWSADVLAGAYYSTPYISLSRCIQVDGCPNNLLYSDQFNNAAWSKTNATFAADAGSAPDGTSTADAIIENSAASASHFVSQAATKSAAAEDWTGTVCAKLVNRSQIRLVIGDSGSNYASAFFDVSAGSVLSGPTTSGTVSNARAVISPLGNGWYQCFLTATIPSTITTANTLFIYMSNGGTSVYTGDGSSRLYLWRAAYARSGVPFLASQTTGAAATPLSQYGPVLSVKGLPSSTNGLLLEGDLAQSGLQLDPVAATLNSDAAGLGYLQLAYPLRAAANDNNPIVVNNPMGLFVLSDNTGGWDESPGVFSNHDFALEEA